MIVVDASVLAPALASDGHDGDVARARLQGQDLAAPEIIDLEVVSVLRAGLAKGSLDGRRAGLAIDDLLDLPVIRIRHAALLPRCWALRDNLTPYDAAYVVAAEILGVTLVTADRRLARSPGLGCDVELIGRATTR